MLLRLKALPRQPASSLNPESNIDSRPASSLRSERSPEPDRNQRPGEGQLRRAHELLAGSWDILSITDDGELLGPDLVRAKFAQNGRIQVGTRAVAIVAPKSGERRLSAIRIDPAKAPSEIDVTTQFDEVLKGIYRFNGDQLILCLAKGDGDDRPTVFEAPAGSNDFLFRLKMATPEPAAPQSGDPYPSLRTLTEKKMKESSKGLSGPGRLTIPRATWRWCSGPTAPSSQREHGRAVSSDCSRGIRRHRRADGVTAAVFSTRL